MIVLHLPAVMTEREFSYRSDDEDGGDGDSGDDVGQ